ncbi:MAG: FAD-dependent oxidoreductase [Thermoplasmata archaeon]|nr:FAD-dependent oxidoreductase [Thermoplasmata archaeon]
MRIVIIGGGAAGATAAQFARKQSRDAEIDIFESTKYPQYSKCGLPYVLTGKISSFENLIEFTEEWFQRNKIRLHLSTVVSSVDVSSKRLVVSDAEREKTISWDSLIFATGASPSLPGIGGILSGDKLREGIFQFRNIDDAKALKEWCAKGKRKILVVGAGLVGLECAEALHELQHQVTVVEYLDSVLPTMIDSDMAEIVASAIDRAGISLRTSASVQSVADSEIVKSANLKSRTDGPTEEIECDTVVLATGIRPTTELAIQAGCEVGKSGHIRVNEKCETSVKDVFAVGDCTQYRDAVIAVEWPVGLGTLAVKMGEIAGKNSAGGDAVLPSGFLYSRVTKLFGLEIGGVGPLSSALSKAGIKYVQSRVKGSTLPPYYPGGKEITVKLTARADDARLLSCQIIGEIESGLRADIIGAAITGGLKVQDLSMLETAYAPPVAPCVDVLTTAAQAIMIRLEHSRKI